MVNSDGVGKINGLLSKITDQLSRNNKKLASGSRITSAADDAAGLAIAEALKSDAVIYKQASRNISDGGSLAQIQSGAIESVSNIKVRLEELATQSANGTLSDAQRGALQEEFSQLSQEAARIVESTQFNGQNVFSGSTNIQVGRDASADSQITLSTSGIAEAVASLSSIDISGQDSARAALESLSTVSNSLSSAQGSIGAQQSRLEVARGSVETQRETALAAESRIRDADIAQLAAENVSLRIRQQATVAVSAQANLGYESVLKLLK